MEDKRGQYNFSTCGKKNHEMEKKNEMKDKEKNWLEDKIGTEEMRR